MRASANTGTNRAGRGYGQVPGWNLQL